MPYSSTIRLRRHRKGLKPPPLFKKDDKLPILVALVMGFQHAIAMLGGLVTPPLLIAGDGCLFNRDAELCAARSYMISSALITSGLLTIIQVIRFRLFKGYYLGTGQLYPPSSCPQYGLDQPRSPHCCPRHPPMPTHAHRPC